MSRHILSDVNNLTHENNYLAEQRKLEYKMYKRKHEY